MRIKLLKQMNDKKPITIKSIVESIIFNSRWLLVPFYLGLIIAQCFYCIKFGENVWDLCRDFHNLNETSLMLAILTLIDITMIANLIKMIITGSYQTFVEKIATDHSEKVSSGLLKVKMGSSLVGVSSIHLLQSFIDASSQSTRELIIKCSIHMIFLVSTIGLAYIDYLHKLSMDTSKETH